MRILRQPNLTHLAHATVAWSVLFAIVHAYWAAGGAAGMHGDPADTPASQGYIGFITLLGLAGAGVAYFLLGGVLFSTLGYPRTIGLPQTHSELAHE